MVPNNLMPPPMLNKIADLRHGIEEGGLQPRDFLLGRLDVALLLVALALHVLLLLLQRLALRHQKLDLRGTREQFRSRNDCH